MTSLSVHSELTPMQVKPNNLELFKVERESRFIQFVQSEVEPFWQSEVKTGLFRNRQALDIHYAYVEVANAKKTMVMSPGRVEGYLKYKELIYDFAQLGYSVFIIDHQGQGLSSRRLKNTHKGYVEDFDDYIEDLDQFIREVVQPKIHGELILLGHSMGSAIGLRYIQSYPDVFSQAVFSSPMWGFISTSIPDGLVKVMINLVNGFSDSFLSENPYFLGGDDYHNVPFEENQLTSSHVRYQYFRDVYQQEPELQLGGITFWWLEQSIKAIDTAFKHEELKKVQTPMLILQSGADNIINNESHFELYQDLRGLHPEASIQAPVVLENAKHELFIESDEIRNRAMSEILQFIR